MSTVETHVGTGTMLDGDNTEANYDGAATWNIGQQCTGFGCNTPSERANVVMEFDISDLKPSTIVQSVLKFTASGAEQKGDTERTIYAYRLDEGFTNDEATWGVSATDTNWTGGDDVGAADNSAITQYAKSASRKLQTSAAVGFRVVDAIELDITELVKDALNRNNGTLLLWVGIPLSDTATTSGFAIVHSPDSATPSYRPKIETIVAERIVWDGNADDGNAQTAGNWVGGVLPDYYDYAIFNDGAIDVSSGSVICNSLFISEGYTGKIEEVNGDPVSVVPNSATGHPVQNKIVINKKEGRFNLKVTVSDIQVDTFISNTPSEVGSQIVNTGVSALQNVYVSKTGNALTLAGTYAFNDIVLSNDRRGSRNVIIESAASPLKAAKSKVTIESALGEFVLSNGTKATASGASTEIASSGTSWIVGNSVMTHRGTSTGAEINIARGRLTFKNNEHADISTSTIVLWKKGIFDARTDVGAWHSKALAVPDIEIKGGGNFFVDVGRTLTITN